MNKKTEKNKHNNIFNSFKSNLCRQVHHTNNNKNSIKRSLKSNDSA